VTTAWHALEPAEVLGRLETSFDGLSQEAAARRLASVGPNRLDVEDEEGAWVVLARQFSSPLVWVLVAAAAVSGLLLGDTIESVAIVVIVVVNAAIGFVQERRAADAVQALRSLAAPTARVVRSGVRHVVPAEEIVPGDVLSLEAGDRVPADARLIEVARLGVEEAALTGESLPVHKSMTAVRESAVLADRSCMVHAGTIVVAGRATAVVVATGAETAMGEIAGMLSEEEPPSPLEREVGRIGRRVALLAGVAAVIVFAVGLASGGPVESLFLTAVALAVAAIPEGLPAVTTITLARGVRSMAEDNAIVRRLPAVEALGAAQVICTDKTGTLTWNRMKVTSMVMGFDGDEPPDPTRFGRAVALCTDAVHADGAWMGDPTETALLEAVDPSMVDVVESRRVAPRVDEIAFDSDRKRMATLHEVGGRYLLVVKGAPEVMVGASVAVGAGGGDRALDEAGRQALLGIATRLAERGLRTIAAAEAWFDRRPASLAAAENELTYLGVVGMADEVRGEVAAAIGRCERAGVAVVMVTGDHEVTARTVAGDIGLLGDREVMAHAGMAATGDAELADVIDGIGVFARVEPADKVRIVKAWQSAGRLVAMTGDGVNDAPALRIADIGVAMGSGTDVAKDAADMVLADDNFASIVAAVERGRAIFANLRRVTYFLLAANLSEITVMLVGFLLFSGYGEPLLAVQLLWINLVTDGLPALALGVDPPAPDVMHRPPDTDRNMLGSAHQLRLLWQGAVLACGPLSMFWLGAVVFGLSWDVTRSMAFTSLVLVQLVHALTVRAQSRGLFRTRVDNTALVASLVASAVVHLVVVMTPFGSSVLGVVGVPWWTWSLMVASALLPAIVIDAVKVAVRRRRPRSPVAWD
jgi:Ca2+-transporting ATPase